MVSGKIDKMDGKIYSLCFTVSVQLLVRSRATDVQVLLATCPKGWIGFGSKCFYFSEDSKNWTFSQTSCTSLGAVLAQFETEEELVRNIFWIMFFVKYLAPEKDIGRTGWQLKEEEGSHSRQTWGLGVHISAWYFLGMFSAWNPVSQFGHILSCSPHS